MNYNKLLVQFKVVVRKSKVPIKMTSFSYLKIFTSVRYVKFLTKNRFSKFLEIVIIHSVKIVSKCI
jgi:hypothetical protein